MGQGQVKGVSSIYLFIYLFIYFYFCFCFALFCFVLYCYNIYAPKHTLWFSLSNH